MDVFYEGHWRLDWGLGNPNKTAILIVELILVSWGFAYWKRWGFWVSLTLSTALELCLVSTYSRGGLAALIVGLTIICLFMQRFWSRIQLSFIFFSFIILVCFAFYVKAASRYSQVLGQEDLSISNRLEIWRVAPRMMLDAPQGWGIGKSGDAYIQWYQPMDRLEQYRTLVNSHLTWLVEMSWLGRILYIQAWILVLLFLRPCPSSTSNWFCIPFGVWVAFAIGAFFSSVAESVWLWIIPICLLLTVLITRFHQKRWPPLYRLKISILVGLLIFISLLIIGYFTSQTFVIQGSPSMVQISLGPKNTKPELFWIIDPDYKIVGKYYGHSIRTAIHSGELSSVGIVNSFRDVHISDFDTVVMMGDVVQNYPTTPSKLVVLNPRGTPAKISTSSLSTGSFKVVWGEFRQNSDLPTWEVWAKNFKGGEFYEAQGAAEYIPNWIDYIKPDKRIFHY